MSVREKRLALFYSRFSHVYYIYTDTNVCTYTAHARAYTHTHRCTRAHTRARSCLLTWDLSLFKYYKETVIHVHDTYRRVSKEGLITQAPFLRLPSMRKSKKRERIRENAKEWMCMWERKTKRNNIESQHSAFFISINYIPNFVLPFSFNHLQKKERKRHIKSPFNESLLNFIVTY